MTHLNIFSNVPLMSHNFWKTIPQPILALAPMAGYTESPFRRLVKEIEPSTVLVSELLSTEAFVHNSEKTLGMAACHPSEKQHYCVQLFGKSEASFLHAIKILKEQVAPDGIDLNLGCPSPKIIGSGYGSALLKDPESTAHLIESIVKATDLPVSVKMRLGFYDDSDLIQTAKNFENAGIAALTIHGRTTKQKFEGNANWEKIYQVKDALTDIPVIGNGDITSAEMAKERLQNLDGIMIGRAAIRNPWIFRQCRQAFEDKEISPIPPLSEQLAFFDRQARMSAEYKNEKIAMFEMRKHFASIIRGFPGASAYRDRLIKVETLEEMRAIFCDIQKMMNDKW